MTDLERNIPILIDVISPAVQRLARAITGNDSTIVYDKNDAAVEADRAEKESRRKPPSDPSRTGD